MDIQIIHADISNLDDILKIENTLEHRNLSDKSIESDLSSTNCYYLCAKFDSNIIGYIGLELLVDHADITGIAVIKEYTRKGIASLLLENAIKVCTILNYDNIFLEVRSSNLSAISLYEKFEFKKINIRKNYYPDNLEDAYIYKKGLPHN